MVASVRGSRRRTRLTLLLLVLLSITLLTLDGRDFGPLGALRSGVSAVLAPIGGALESVTRPVRDAFGGLGSSEDLRSENDQLRQRIEELEQGEAEAARARSELDQLAATGEQASSALLAIALQAEGMPSVSYAGWQVAIKTDASYTKARIESIDDARVRADLAQGKVVIITGFQGVDDDGNITTLGRGGSDTSAVAVAASAVSAARASAGTTRLIRWMRRASSASMVSLSRAISSALRRPTQRTKPQEVLQSELVPMRG